MIGIKERQDREEQTVRESILTAARDLFVMEGYAHVSIRKFAERIESPRLAVGLRPARRPRYRPSGTRDGLSYENGAITSAELTDAQGALLQTEYLLQQAKYARIVATARARFAAGMS